MANMKMKNAMVFCEKNELGTLDFYLVSRGRKRYLFTTRYYSYTVYREYSGGMRLEDNYKKTARFRQTKLRERILRMAKYCFSAEAAGNACPAA